MNDNGHSAKHEDAKYDDALKPARRASFAGELKRILPSVPETFGVYCFLDANEKALYIGKAKVLRNRLSNYTKDDISTRMMVMMSVAKNLKWTICENETQALLFEAAQIKSLQPRYNILLKDDKSFPEIMIDTSHEFPSIKLHRGKHVKNATYFGPFAKHENARHTLDLIQKICMIRDCKDTDFAIRKRPCMQYHIKRCTAPCVGNVDFQQYGSQVKIALDTLNGKSKEIADKVYDKMMKCAADTNYEEAAKQRNMLASINAISFGGKLDVKIEYDCDVLAFVRDGGVCCMYCLFIRGGNNYGDISVFPKNIAEQTDDEIIEHCIMQFYETRVPPKNIIINVMPENSESILNAMSQVSSGFKYSAKGGLFTARPDCKGEISEADAVSAVDTMGVAGEVGALSDVSVMDVMDEMDTVDVADAIDKIGNVGNVGNVDKAGRLSVKRFKMFVPKIGDAKKIIDFAVANAQEAMNRNFSTTKNIQEQMFAAYKVFGLTSVPDRIEVFDNSHTHGTNCVGGMIVFGERGFMKKFYRKFNFSDLVSKGGDDYSMMRDMLTRRLRAIKDIVEASVASGDIDLDCEVDGLSASAYADLIIKNEIGEPLIPSLWLIDGGFGHKTIVEEVMRDVDFYVPFVCISKGPNRNAGEEIFHMTDVESFTLPKNDKLMYFLQTLRDEAHRFAINTHRGKRSKAMTVSELDDIDGIGEARKKALLRHFGSLKNIKAASAKEIAKVDRIGESVALDIYNAIHGIR